MYSLNVPVPGAVAELAGELRPQLLGFETVRDRHTLVLKRLGDLDQDSFPPVEKAVRRALDDAPAVEAAVTGIDAIPDPASGPAPVVYLAVESPGLLRLHRRLTGVVAPVDGIEGPDYVPHITLARGGGSDAPVDRLVEAHIEPIRWTVNRLEFWDAHRAEPAGRISLPG